MNNVNQPAFRPEPAKTVNLAAGVASANVQVQAGNLSRHVRIFNSGSVTVFVKPGPDNTVTASVTTDYPIGPGTIEIITSPYPYIAAITASGTATIYFTPGEGI